MPVIPFDKQLNQHANAIGFVCIHWTWLEQLTDYGLAHLMGLEADSAEANCALIEMDFRAKLRALKHIGFTKKIDDSWFDKLEVTVNKIDNELRVRRSRFVHDIWTTTSEGSKVTKTYQRVTLKRPQSRQPYEMSTMNHEAVEAGDIVELANDIVIASNDLFQFFHRLDGFSDTIAE